MDVKRPDNTTWMLLFLLFGGSWLLPADRTGDPAGKTGNPMDSTATRYPDTDQRSGLPTAEHEFLRLIQEFLGPDQPQIDGEPFGHVAERIRELNFELRFLIVTAPDPVDSKSTWQLDPHLEALTLGLGVNDFILDRYSGAWWNPNSRRELSGKENTPNHVRYDRSNPGILLYRKLNRFDSADRPENDTLLVVLLVAETPTEGIHKTAFRNALKLIKSWRGVQKDPDSLDPQIDVLGPMFSGSTESLRLAIAASTRDPEIASLGANGVSENFQESLLEFRIRSGSASSVDVSRLESAGCVDFRSTVLNDTDVQTRTFEFLTELSGGQCPRVALLSESSTGYGSSTETGGKGCPVLKIKFPLQIYGLRKEYEKVIGEPPSISTSASKLSVSLGDEIAATDVIPSQTPRTTSPSVELGLDTLFQTLERERIEYVGILATDTRDKIFLARLIDQNAPNLRLFTFEGDLLYAHPEFSAWMRGMLVASTYPLFNQSQLWSVPFGEKVPRIQFSSTAAQGVYNAVQLLLDNPSRMLDYPLSRVDSQGIPETEQPGCRLYSEENLPKSGGYLPSLWFSVVGNGGLWPLAVRSLQLTRPRYTFQAQYPETSKPSPVHYATWPVHFLLGVLSLIAFWHVWRYRDDWRSSTGNPEGDEIQAYVFLSSCALLLMYACVATVESADLVQFHRNPWLAFPVFAIVPVLLWPIARSARSPGFLKAMLHFKEAESTAEAPAATWLRWALWFVLRIGGLAVNLGVFFCFFLGPLGQMVQALPDTKLEPMLFLARVATPTNGVSPLLPVVLWGIVYYLCVLCQIQRLRMPIPVVIRSNTPAVFRQFIGERFFRDWQNLSRQALASPATGAPLPWLTTGLIVLLSFWLFGYPNAAFTLEPGLNRWFEVGFALFQIMGVLSVFHFLAIWKSNRAFLGQLNGSELRGAFRRLPPILSRLFQARICWQSPQFAHLGPAAERARRLAKQMQMPGAVVLTPSPDSSVLSSSVLNQIVETYHRERQASPAMHWSDSETWGLLCGISGPLFTLVQSLQDSCRQSAGAPEKNHPDPKLVCFQTAQDLLAIQIVLPVRELLTHQWHSLLPAFAIVLSGLFSMALYPFQPQFVLLLLALVCVLGLGAATLWVFLQVDRETVLSYWAGTQPGTTFDRYWIGVIIAALIPFLTLLATQFPQLKIALSMAQEAQKVWF